MDVDLELAHEIRSTSDRGALVLFFFVSAASTACRDEFKASTLRIRFFFGFP
jgi:hypothetical protein